MSEAPGLPSHAETTAQNTRDGERSKRFRFKSKRNEHRGDDESRGHKRRKDDDSSHRYRKRRRSSRHPKDRSRSQERPSNYLSPDQAFRESLFDALGDDEGAAFWEGVYGQPIHKYPDTYKDEETGELERMTDEEYAQFVRRKMWEKSWEGMEAAKEEQRREREREKQRIRDEENRTESERQARQDDHIFNKQIEASLQRGEKRKERKRWQGLWEDYLRRWADLQLLAQNRQKSEDDGEQLFLRNKIAWPVESGKRKDVKREEIERFIRKGTAAAYEASEGRDPFSSAVKAERVRWHPDKIQQRYGFMEIDEDILKAVTAVFQVLDALWNEIRDKPA
ncbi:uncharacterized protein Z520_07711 [Fonsecaea multimorphosa CBS 102226]|uniref:J domain-containing protein n=1 Tax=Fonsecaea multimorphosa CBS 102226 TaxID=1442371 RepID=A0A0D2H3P1_9EURO|nr:uncharacterized protein Z520_07711 [Fonsecaea multimorphosa CBS 102226]KIX96445.1 hypothetical protein Z520_07711 [Fonsecaea multimorphosa CBS 102226]OAL22355.1 hypothetical protein AYO22_07399 [Fonsecaea multimorphosa]